MLKRTKGRLLLTLLVATGLAGTLDNNSVSQKERKFAVTYMKESKKELLEEIKGLSSKQLNYKSPATQLSVKKCLFNAAWAEQKLWQTVTAVMKQPANPEMRREIRLTDEQVIAMTENGTLASSGAATFKQANSPWKDVDEAINSFRTQRNEHIRYMKTSTEDLRNHVIETPAGWMDCYQYILLMSAESKHYLKQIEQITTEEKFPKK